MKFFPLNGRVGQVKYGHGKKCLSMCRPLAKYQLENKKWTKKIEKAKSGRAFSIASLNREVGRKAGDKNAKFVSFIMLDGTRVENFSGTGNRPGVSGWGISRYLTELDKADERIRPTVVLVDNDGPLEEQSRLLAEYVNHLKSKEDCKKVIVFGQSKCGCMAISMLKYLKDDNLDKLDIQVYQAPFLGTVLATPLKLYQKVDSIYTHLSNKFFRTLISKVEQLVLPRVNKNSQIDKKEELDNKVLLRKIKNTYWETLSQSHMDFDIAEIGEGGIPEGYEDRYDPNFLGNMFDKRTLECLKKVKVTNITTKCTPKTLENAMKNLNGYGAMLYVSSKLLFDEEADGMVTLKSSKYIEEVCKQSGIPLRTRTIDSGHHYPTGDTKLIHTILEPILKEKTKEKELR